MPVESEDFVESKEDDRLRNDLEDLIDKTAQLEKQLRRALDSKEEVAISGQ